MYVCSISTSISYEEQANKCKYPVSGSVRLRPEQICAVTDSVPEQRQLDNMSTSNEHFFKKSIAAMNIISDSMKPPLKSHKVLESTAFEQRPEY